MPAAPYGFHANDDRPLPESVDDETIARLVAEAEAGIPAEKLRRRGRPAMGDEAASTYSVRLPDDLVTLADQRSQIDSVTRGGDDSSCADRVPHEMTEGNPTGIIARQTMTSVVR